MIRDVSAHLELSSDGKARIALAIAADCAPASELLRIEQGGAPVNVEWLTDPSGTRFAFANISAGDVQVAYEARVEGREVAHMSSRLSELIYLRPSRYCESDTLAPIARAEFAGLDGRQLADAVSSWVGTSLSYVPGWSSPTDGAVHTLLERQGVCRDYAHLVVALLRALEVPARVASVYAPGLDPMDFHAVAEAAIDGVWCAIDATALAPRESLLRIATGRDASDIAFLDTQGADVRLGSMTVMATVDTLPADDVTQLVSLG